MPILFPAQSADCWLDFYFLQIHFNVLCISELDLHILSHSFTFSWGKLELSKHSNNNKVAINILPPKQKKKSLNGYSL